jgi:SAM-dependent methyltransferase
MHDTDDTIDAELAYQAERAARLREVGPTPAYIIERYRRCRWWRLFPKEFVFRRVQQIDGKEILEFGCGEGQVSTQLARLGARVTAIDISPELIAIAARRARLDGVRDRIEFVLGDITQSVRPRAKFDIALCLAALHHVDLRSVAPLVLACVKPGGVVIMMEPIALSPFLQRLRNLVPIANDASPEERQLNGEDLDFLRHLVADAEIRFFNLFGRLARLFPHANEIDRGHPVTKAALVLLLGVDRLLLRLFPGLRRWCGSVVIVGRKPHRRGATGG